MQTLRTAFKWLALLVALHTVDGRTVYLSKGTVEYVTTPTAGLCFPGTRTLVQLESGHILCLAEDPETVQRLLDSR